MINKYSILISSLLFSLNIHAQTVLQSHNLPVVGEVWSNKQITDTTIQPGPGGANQIWNFSNYFVSPAVISESYEAPTGSGNDALFPTSNIKVTSFFGGYDYFYKTANELQYLGSKSSSGEIIITNTQTIILAPLIYGDSITNQPVTGTGLSGYAVSGTISAKADGWGDLTLFTGGFTNTLRVTTRFDLIQGQGTGLDTYITLEKYTWYKSGHRAPVFQISILNVDGPLGNTRQKFATVSTLTTDINSLSDNNFDFTVSPNPVHSNLSVSFNTKNTGDVTLRILDLSGKIISEEKSAAGNGVYLKTLDVSTLPEGYYFISAEVDGKTSRRSFIKN